MTVAPKLPWDMEESSGQNACAAFDQVTPAQRQKAAQAISIRLLYMADSLKGRTDVDAAADRDYANCLAGRLSSGDPAIDDIWIAAELLREHERRVEKQLALTRPAFGR